jgi:hypothetical protein
MSLKSILILFYLCLISFSINGQRSYALRLKLFELDTMARTACYDLQISNQGTQPWYLGNANILIFYDYSVGCLLPSQSGILLDDIIYDINNLEQKNPNTGLPLPFANTLGSVRVNFNANDFGLLLDSLGTWHSIIRLCFQLEIENITDPSTCFQASFLNDDIAPFLPVIDIVEAYNPDPTMTVGLPRDTAYDLIPDATFNTCFILEENTVQLCNDGIDNDEDGLVDCDDVSACAPENPSFNVNQPGGCDGRPSLIRVNDITGAALYSIDDGVTFQSSNEFVGLEAGDYVVLIVKNGVDGCGVPYPIRLIEEECRENTNELCSDGIDNDEDGLVDCMDGDCNIAIEELIITSPIICPDFNDGSIQLVNVNDSYQISIDSGATYLSGTMAEGLSAGVYLITAKNRITGCESVYEENPLEISTVGECPPEVGFCNDGIDNDLDGLVDCADDDCIGDIFCEEPAKFYIPNAINPLSSVNANFGMTTEDNRPIELITFQIFDRWGTLIHSRSNTTSADPFHFWNGTYQNKLVAPGVFIYHMTITQSGITSNMSGSLTVVY